MRCPGRSAALPYVREARQRKLLNTEDSWVRRDRNAAYALPEFGEAHCLAVLLRTSSSIRRSIAPVDVHETSFPPKFGDFPTP